MVMPVKFLPPDEDVESILSSLGFKSLEEFMNRVLEGFPLWRADSKWEGLDEVGLVGRLEEIGRRNRLFRGDRIFIGMGVEPTWVSPVVKAIVGRGEFLTSYTPYQPEMSQGMLQALYEYQSVMADILNMDVVNSSMYDGSSAAAEALLLSERVLGRKRVLIPDIVYPPRRKVIETYLYGAGIEIDTYPLPSIDGDASLGVLEEKLRKGASAVYVEFPDSYGYLTEYIDELSDIVHRSNTLLVSYTDLWSTFIALAPGDYQADIAVAEGQPLGLEMGCGGPLLGVFAVSNDLRLIRNMPGRLIGETRTVKGGKAYTMVLQTREQHIRRADATSNICTNEALSAIQVLMNILLMGRERLVDTSLKMSMLAHSLLKGFKSLGIRDVSNSPFTRSFTLDLSGLDYRRIYGEVVDRGFLPGYLWDDGFLTVTVNMLHRRESIDEFLAVFKEVMENV